MDVRSVMTVNPACCTADTPLREVARMMVANDCGQIPVVDAANAPIGVVTDRDIAVRIVAAGRDTATARAADCMTTPVTTVSDDSSVAECCEAMAAQQVRRVPVVDADGSLCGIVSLADIALSSRDQKIAEVVKHVSEPKQRSDLNLTTLPNKFPRYVRHVPDNPPRTAQNCASGRFRNLGRDAPVVVRKP